MNTPVTTRTTVSSNTALLPLAVVPASAGRTPVLVVVAGQPGSGKTTLADILEAVLARRGRVARLARDRFKEARPDYRGLLEANVRTAGAALRTEAQRWQERGAVCARARGVDALAEDSLEDLDAFRRQSAAFRGAGYRVEVVVVATSPALSALRITRRFVALGGAQYVSWEAQDRCVAALPKSAAAVEEERLADRVTVVRGDDYAVLYSNELAPYGAWAGECGAGAAVADEHARPWTARETYVHRAESARIDRILNRALGEDPRLAIQRDAERAAALAEPVRRIAQPIPGPPGVDYHRLSASEHEWIWANLIAPSSFESITPHEDPVTTYILGQPGAGTTGLAYLVRRASRRRRAIHISEDHFAAEHPDSWRLWEQDPRNARARVAADVKAWQRRAEALVRGQRGDMVVEMAPRDDASQFAESVRADRSAGRRVAIVVLAVREADSLQRAAATYARAAGRECSIAPAEHDRCVRGLADVVEAVERDGLADEITVVGRDAVALHRNERDPQGRCVRPGAAAAALWAGQHRPYGHGEAAAFRAVQQELRVLMPQFREDIEEIERRARPLMPEYLRPRPLPRPAPALWQPLVPVAPASYAPPVRSSSVTA